MSQPDVEANPPISSLAGSLLVRADEGRTLHAFGLAVVILLDGKQTGEKFTAFLNVTPPGSGPGLHYHEREDEWFYIVEGRVSFLIRYYCKQTRLFRVSSEAYSSFGDRALHGITT